MDSLVTATHAQAAWDATQQQNHDNCLPSLCTRPGVTSC